MGMMVYFLLGIPKLETRSPGCSDSVLGMVMFVEWGCSELPGLLVRASGVPQGSPLLMAAFPFLWLRFTCAVFAGHTHCPCWQCSLLSVTAPLSPAGTWGAQALHTPCSWLCSFPNTAAPEPPPLLLVTMQPVLLSRQSWRRPKQVLPPCTAEFSDAACPHGPALPVCSPALASQAGPEGLQSTQL